MREENRSEIIHDALNFLDEKMIEEVDNLRGGVAVGSVSYEQGARNEKASIKVLGQKKEKDTARKMSKLIYSWRKWATLAAGICLIVLVGNAWTLLQKTSFGSKNLSGSNQANDGIREESIADVNQSGATGMSPEKEVDKYEVEDSVGDINDYQENLGQPQSSETIMDENIVKLQNYTAVYFSEVKNQNPSDAGRVLLSEADYEILDKFLDSMQRGTTSVVDAASQFEMMNKADGQLVFELEDGTSFHLILIADGMVCSDETPNVWIQMDKRVYRILIESLKEDS